MRTVLKLVALVVGLIVGPCSAFLTTPNSVHRRVGFARTQTHCDASKRLVFLKKQALATLRASDGTNEERSKAEILAEELKTDLVQMFDLSYEPKWSLYADDVLFMDPLNKFTGIQKYKDNIKMLKDSPLFTGGKMDLHEVKVVSKTQVDTRWTLAMTFKPFPWQPSLLFTGTTKYIIDEKTGLVVKHLDEWDSLSNNQPVSMEGIAELISQMLPDVARLGAVALRGRAVGAAPYKVIRKFANGIEIRRYSKHVRVATPKGEVYNRESYEYASNLLLQYRGDALAAPQNSEQRILAVTEPMLQEDSGDSDSFLAYILPSDTLTAPRPKSSELRVIEVPDGTLVASLSSRGFGSDRSRTEVGLEQQRNDLSRLVSGQGFEVVEIGGAFTLANYADGYEMWLNVKPKE